MENVTLESLEKRITTLESIVNQVLMQMHDLTQQVEQLQTPPPKAVPSARDRRPKQTEKPKPQQLSEKELKQQEARCAANKAAVGAIQQALADGEPRTEKALLELTGISRSRLRKVRGDMKQNGILSFERHANGQDMVYQIKGNE